MEEMRYEGLTEGNSERFGLMTVETQGQVPAPACVVCDEQAAWDLLAFRRQRDQHVLDAMMELWAVVVRKRP